MNEWTTIRRKVLVDKASKRSIYRDHGIGWRTLKKILEHPVPPATSSKSPWGKPKLGPVLPIIEQILADDKDAPAKQRHTAKRSSSASATSTTMRAGSPRSPRRSPGPVSTTKRSSSPSRTRRATPDTTSARRR